MSHNGDTGSNIGAALVTLPVILRPAVQRYWADFTAAAEAVADMVTADDCSRGILTPPVKMLKEVSYRVACAVGREAIRQNLSGPCVYSKYQHNNDPERLERHMIGDVDGDGDSDVVIVKNLRGDLLWFENSGTPTAGRLWKRHVITTDLPGAYDVALADFDKDGDLDVAGSSWVLGNQFAWFENNGKPGEGEWQKHMIEADVPETRTMRTADLDRDGDPDLMGTIRAGDETVWYENISIDDRITWHRHVIDNKSRCPAHGNCVDMDRDGDLDVVMALGFVFDPESKDPTYSKLQADNQIVWYENDGTRNSNWKKHVVQEKFDDAFEATAADLDGDGDIDIAATTWRNPGRLAWFENTGDPRKGWIRHILKENWRSANQVIIADMNGDGKPDIIACAERGSVEVRWWRNEGRPEKP